LPNDVRIFALCVEGYRVEAVALPLSSNQSFGALSKLGQTFRESR